MSEVKYTPGPWKYEGGNDACIDIILPNDTTISIDRMSRFTATYVISREEMEANAKLIAAAPELLEALQGLVNDVKNKPNDTRYATHLKIALSAIKKATT